MYIVIIYDVYHVVITFIMVNVTDMLMTQSLVTFNMANKSWLDLSVTAKERCLVDNITR